MLVLGLVRIVILMLKILVIVGVVRVVVGVLLEWMWLFFNSIR